MLTRFSPFGILASPIILISSVGFLLAGCVSTQAFRAREEEAVICGLATFESEFLGSIVIPGGETLGEWAKPQLEKAYATNEEPTMLRMSSTHLEGGMPSLRHERWETAVDEVSGAT
jgi:hypothetical protein